MLNILIFLILLFSLLGGIGLIAAACYFSRRAAAVNTTPGQQKNPDQTVVISVNETTSDLKIAEALLKKQSKNDSFYEEESKTRIPLTPVLFEEEKYAYINSKKGKKVFFETKKSTFLLVDNSNDTSGLPEEVYAFDLKYVEGSDGRFHGCNIRHSSIKPSMLKGNLLMSYLLSADELKYLGEKQKNMKCLVAREPYFGYSVYILYTGFENTIWLDKDLECLKEKGESEKKNNAIKQLFLKCALALKKFDTKNEGYGSDFGLENFVINTKTEEVTLLEDCAHKYAFTSDLKKKQDIYSLFCTFEQIVGVVYSTDDSATIYKNMEKILRGDKALLKEFNTYCKRKECDPRVRLKLSILALDKFIELLENSCPSKASERNVANPNNPSLSSNEIKLNGYKESDIETTLSLVSSSKEENAKFKHNS